MLEGLWELKWWERALALLLAVGLGAAILLQATPAGAPPAKPTTTTAGTTTTTVAPAPALGVPHVVTKDFFGPTPPDGMWSDVSCPAGEVALSASTALIRNGNGEVNIDTPSQAASWVPTGDPPTGYRFILGSTYASDHERLYVTCAPVQ